MTIRGRALIAAVVLVCTAAAGLPAHADDNGSAKSGPAPQAHEPTLQLIGKKLRRGAVNTSLGWLEVPVGVQEIGSQHGVGAAATWGLVHGTGRAVQRTAVGLFEILTFPFALTQDYKPIIEPEFVLDKSRPAAPAPGAVEIGDSKKS